MVYRSAKIYVRAESSLCTEQCGVVCLRIVYSQAQPAIPPHDRVELTVTSLSENTRIYEICMRRYKQLCKVVVS